MTGYDLPDGCSESDIPGNSQKDIAWENAMEGAAMQIDTGQFDIDDVIKAVGRLSIKDLMELSKNETVRDMMIELRAKEISDET